MSLLTDDGIHSFPLDDILFGFITGIKEQILPLIFLLVNQRFNDIGIMYACVCSVVFLYKFGFLVCLDMILVTIVIFTAFLRPAGINVLVRFLVLLAGLLPFRIAFFRVSQVFGVA